MIKKRALCMIITIAGVLLTLPVWAEQKEVIVIGGDHNPPFRIIDGESYTGIYGEMIHEIVKGMNLEVQFRECPFQRCVFEMQDGKIDVFLALVKRIERETFLYYVEPFIKDRTDRAFYLRKGEGDRIQTYEDLYGLDIGILTGVKLTKQFDTDVKLNKQAVPTHEQNFRKLVTGRIDTFVHTEIAIDYQLRHLGYLDKIEKAPFKFTKIQPTYFVISKKSKYVGRIPEFEANLKRLSEEKTFWKLVEKWSLR